MQHLEVYEIPPEASQRTTAVKMHPDARPMRVVFDETLTDDPPRIMLVCMNASLTQVSVDRYFRLVPRAVEVPSPAAPPEFIDSFSMPSGIWGLWEVFVLIGSDGKPVELSPLPPEKGGRQT